MDHQAFSQNLHQAVAVVPRNHQVVAMIPRSHQVGAAVASSPWATFLANHLGLVVKDQIQQVASHIQKHFLQQQLVAMDCQVAAMESPSAMEQPHHWEALRIQIQVEAYIQKGCFQVPQVATDWPVVTCFHQI